MYTYNNPAKPVSASEAEFRDDFAVFLDFLVAEVVQKSSSAANHDQKASARVVILFVDLEVLGKLVDPACKQCYLDFR